MITKEDYLKAKEVIKQYNLQEKIYEPRKSKTELFLEKSNDEIKQLLNKHFEVKNYCYFTHLSKIIQEVYFEAVGKKVGRNYAVIILRELVKRGVIRKEGEHGFQTYFLN